MSETEEVIFIDHSIHSAGATCEEKGRLAYVEHLVPIAEQPPLVFGSAFHAAVASLYSNVGLDIEEAILLAQRAFTDEVRVKGPSALPISADSEERRSIERGYYLIEYYARKWRHQDVHWADITYFDPETGEVKPYVEIGFSIYFMDWHGVPVVCVGKIDRLRRNRIDNNAYVWETKTTSSGTSRYTEQVRPNHQLTTYKWAARELVGMDVSGIMFDVVHVSERKMGGKFPHGIDNDKDFARVETRRSSIDIDEFLYDLKRFTTRWLTFRDELRSGVIPRGHRNAPAACYMYGGCHYRRACESNLNAMIMKNYYKRHVWHPWEHDKPKLVLGKVMPFGVSGT